MLAEGARRQKTKLLFSCHFLLLYREAKIFKGSCYTSSLEQVDSFQGFLEHSGSLLEHFRDFWSIHLPGKMGLYEFGQNGARLRQAVLKDVSCHLVTPLGSLCKLDFSV